jgi:Sigma-70, region 4
MTDADFKKKNRPAMCTEDPFLAIVPKDKLHETLNYARQRSRDIGQEDYDQGCPKRFTCDGNCTGRPVPKHIPELKPYIAKLQHLISPDGLMYINKCGSCPIAKTCKRTCSQIADYMDRGKNKDDITNKFDISQVSTDYALGNFVSDDSEPQPGVLSELINRYGSIQDAIENLPWGAINEKRARLVRMYCFEGRDFRACAKELGYSNGTVARNEFYRSLTTLSKFATVRHFIEAHRDDIADLDNELLRLRYYQFLTVNEIAVQLNLKIGTVRSRLFRFINRSRLTYSKYVNKNKVIPSSIF